jgi:hypothetical protein
MLIQMYDKKNLKSYGAGGEDDADFLAVDDADGNWTAGASGHGYNARWNDERGYERGTGAYTDSDSGLVNKLSDEAQANIRDIGNLIDSEQDQPTGPITGGGGPVSDNERDPDDSTWRGSSRKGPRYSNPLGAKGQGNIRGWKK